MKFANVNIWVTVGIVEIKVKGVKINWRYISGKGEASQTNYGWPWDTKWALAKGNLGTHDPPDAHDEYLHNFTSS